MTIEQWIEKLKQRADGDLATLAKGVPLGENENGETVFSQTREKPFTVRHTCVSGENRTEYILSLIRVLNELYEKGRVSFLIVSPKTEYSSLLTFGVDATLPFVREKADLTAIKNCVCSLVELQTREKNCPRLVLVMDGLESVVGCNESGDLAEYRETFSILARRENVDIITGVELMQSIFSGYPGAFVGVGNTLVSTRENGKADVTQVLDDSSLSLPVAINTPVIL